MEIPAGTTARGHPCINRNRFGAAGSAAVTLIRRPALEGAVT